MSLRDLSALMDNDFKLNRITRYRQLTAAFSRMLF